MTPSPGLSRPARLAISGLLLLVTVAAAWQTQRLVDARQQTRFDYETRRLDLAIQQRMQAYVQVLRGGLGLFAASDEVTREDWRLYVGTLALEENYPGIRTVSFAPAVPVTEAAAFVEQVRRSPPHPQMSSPAILAGFNLRPPPPPIEPAASDLRAPVLYTEPLSPENEKSLGVDMMMDAGRQATMLAARDSGDAVLSSRLRLLRVSGTQVGFIAYLPVERLGRHLGWLTAVFYAEDFMRGLFGTDPGPLEFAVYDGDSASPDTLLYSTAGVDAGGEPRPLPAAASDFERSSPLEMPGRRWTAHYRSAADFLNPAAQLMPWLVALGGLLITALFHSTALAAARWREQAAALARAESAVRHQATHDPLTGLANRALFMDRLETALERARRRNQSFALAYLDIDGFKPVNDTHGHQAGDELLKAIAQRLSAQLRKEDTVARLGGDEFALVLEVTADLPAVALRLCNEVIARLREPFELPSLGPSRPVCIGASVGLAVFPQHGRERDALIAAADAAMYRAKRGGKNRCELAEES